MENKAKTYICDLPPKALFIALYSILAHIMMFTLCFNNNLFCPISYNTSPLLVPLNPSSIPIEPSYQIRMLPFVKDIKIDQANARSLMMNQAVSSNFISILNQHNEYEIDIRMYLNVFFSKRGAIGRSFPLAPSICGSPPGETVNNSLEVKRYDSVVTFIHRFSNNFFHFMAESVSHYDNLPRDILESSVVHVHSKSLFVTEVLTLYNISESQVITVNEGEVAFAHRLYTSRGYPCSRSIPSLLFSLRDKLVKIYDLDKSPPTQYAIHYIKKGQRFFINMDQILKTLSTEFPKQKFIVLGEKDTVEKQCKVFNSLRLVIGIHGANFLPTLIMQPGMVLCEIFGSQLHYHYASIARFMKLVYIFSQNKEIGQTGPTTVPVDPAMVVEMISKGLELIHEEK